MWSSNLEKMVGANENIIWKGKPDKKCFLLESIFNPMLVIAIIWGAMDLAFFGISIAGTGANKEVSLFLIPFFALHSMPVWIYLGGIIFSVQKYKNTEYIITDRGIYISGGIFAYTYEMKPFTDLSHINIRRGIFDQWLGVGDVISDCSHGGYDSRGRHSSHRGYNFSDQHFPHGAFVICDIADYQKVFKIIKDLQTDIYSDTMYPNDLRPQENHGYQTQYIPKDPW